MPKYQGWIIHKQYFKVELEAKSWEEAREKIWDVEVDFNNADDVDSEIYDIEEMQNA